MVHDLPRRPKFWLHRTRRFWMGLGLLLFLVAWWAAACCFETYVACLRVSPLGKVAIGYPMSLTEIGFRSGGVFFEHDETSDWASAPHPSSGRWSGHTRKLLESHLAPLCSYHEPGNEFATRLFFPLWPLPLLWGLLWPVWMHRRDLKEEKRFSALWGKPGDDSREAS